MYGFIYNTLRSLVVGKFGEEAWAKICAEADCPVITEGIVERRYYDESILKRIEEVAEKQLGVPREKILELFGQHFFEICKQSGHSSMLKTLGQNLYGFLMNLDSLHDHLSFTYTEMQAPSFLCEKTSVGLILHYYSQRPGLSSIVLGIVKAVAKDFYSLDINMTVEKYEQIPQKLAHHYMFNIEVQNVEGDDTYLERLTGETPNPLPVAIAGVLDHRTDRDSRSPSVGPPIQCPIVNISEENALEIEKVRTQLTESLLPISVLPRIPSRMASRRGSGFPIMDAESWPITQHMFQTCFPFHILFDRDLTIRFLGISLNRLLPKAILRNEKLTDHFELTRPALAMTYDNIRSSIHNIFIMRTKNLNSGKRNSPEAEPLHFRGQMVPTSTIEGSLILFLGSPRISSVEELENQGLYLSDIPVHDVTRDLILLNRHFRVEMGIAKELEETKQSLQFQKARAEEEKHRADALLHAMLPKPVATELKRNHEVSAMDFPEVTILFSDIKGFTNICNKCTPIQVVEMLNRLYTYFDSQIERHNVYKVETIGDAYMVAAGLLDTSKDHAAAITNMAFEMREIANKVMDPVHFEPLKIRIGVHSGGVVAGVVGRKMPRYCLFGGTVNTASRMESHGEPGRIHISDDTYHLLKDKTDQYEFYSRGLIEVKGLGQRQTYFVERPGEGNFQNISESDSSLELSPQPFVNNLRNSSFVEFKHPKKVQPETPVFDEPPTPFNGARKVPELRRPKRVSSSSITSPILEEDEIVSGNSNGVTSLFISDSQTSVSNTHHSGRKHKNKCIVS